MSNIKDKLSSIDKKINSIDEKMKQLMLQKKELMQQRKDIEEQEILSVVRSNGSSLDTIDNDMALIRLLKENNLTKEDILELVTPLSGTSSSSIMNAHIRNGGQSNGNN